MSQRCSLRNGQHLPPLSRYIIRANHLQFSISRNDTHGTGIHQKPDVFPPDEEVKQQRYHYLVPKVVMPKNVFLHFLHRARWNVWGEHKEDVWLKRLPKKLNESLRASTGGQTDPDLLFGWGVHIINGPNHAALWLLLAIGICITLVVSLIILGAAKTQEQAFGVGNYLLTIIVCIMAAAYFQLMDQ